MSLVLKVLVGFRPDLLYFTRGEFVVHLGRGNWRENAPIKPAPSITPVIYNIHHPLVLYIFTIIFNHIFAQPPAFRTVGKDWRPPESVRVILVRTERRSRERRRKTRKKSLKIRQIARFDFSPSLFLSFRSLFGLFQVSFWSLLGLFQVLSGNRGTETVQPLRENPRKYKVKYW